MTGKWRVDWDNGANACGTFAQAYDTEAEAQSVADAWVAEMCAMDGLDPEAEGVYSAEVREEEAEVDDDTEQADPRETERY
jgi:hypothetical protein